MGRPFTAAATSGEEALLHPTPARQPQRRAAAAAILSTVINGILIIEAPGGAARARKSRPLPALSLDYRYGSTFFSGEGSADQSVRHAYGQGYGASGRGSGRSDA